MCYEYIHIYVLKLEMPSVVFQQFALGADARASRTVVPAALGAGGEETSLPICMLNPIG